MEKVFKLKPNFLSLVSISALVGFCAGVVSIPLFIVQVLTSPEPSVIAIGFVVILSPLAGFLNGGLFGVVGFPLYRLLAERIGFKYKGVLWVES